MIAYKMVRSAIAELGINKMRTGLTMLGIIIGVGAVIALMSVGQGASKGISAEVNGLGSNLVFVDPGAPDEGGDGGDQGFAIAFSLTDSDVETLQTSTALPDVEAVTSVMQTPLEPQVVAGNRTSTATMTATDQSFLQVRDFELAAGAFLTKEDLDRRRMNVVLGWQAATDLFDDATSAVGQRVRLNFGPFQLNLTVVGVLKEQGANSEEDAQIFIPVSTFRARVPFGRSPTGTQFVSQIIVRVNDSDHVDSTAAQIRNVLLQEHDLTENFTVSTQNDLKETANRVSRTLTILLGAIAGISLVVGGIGIMNIMLVSVTERTREIGIRKAVGARRRDILLQFIIETVVVTVLGGAVGVAIGVIVARLADGQDFGTGSAIGTIVALNSIAIAFGVSVLIGLFFGIYPAYRASRLDPIEALRTE
ncbi:MAG: ABC transporter permease [Dehalococcoidia bacterium]